MIAGKLSSVTVFNWTAMRVFGASWDREYARERVVGDKASESGDYLRGEEGSSGEWAEEDGVGEVWISEFGISEFRIVNCEILSRFRIGDFELVLPVRPLR